MKRRAVFGLLAFDAVFVPIAYAGDVSKGGAELSFTQSLIIATVPPFLITLLTLIGGKWFLEGRDLKIKHRLELEKIDHETCPKIARHLLNMRRIIYDHHMKVKASESGVLEKCSPEVQSRRVHDSIEALNVLRPELEALREFGFQLKTRDVLQEDLNDFISKPDYWTVKNLDALIEEATAIKQRKTEWPVEVVQER